MEVQDALAKIESMVGQQVGSGQCYALSAYYEYLINPDATVELGGGVTERISGLIKGGLNASDIGEDYRWAAQGWEIRYNPRDISQITVGCIINWHAGGMHTTGLYPVNSPYGHTGVVYAIKNGVIYTYEQNNGGQFIRKFAGSNLSGISSVCIPPKNEPKPKEEKKKLPKGTGGTIMFVVKLMDDHDNKNKKGDFFLFNVLNKKYIHVSPAQYALIAPLIAAGAIPEVKSYKAAPHFTAIVTKGKFAPGNWEQVYNGK